MQDAELVSAFEACRPRMRTVAYRILGSLADAEDTVQEAWLRLQRVNSSSEQAATGADRIENLEAWLTTVTTRIALNMIRDRDPIAERPLEAFFPEPVVEQPSSSDPEHELLLADAVGVAMQVVLETLSPAERVAFVLHDMFAVPFSQVASLLERSPDATRQLASRARRQVRERAPLPDAGISAQREAVDAYFRASRGGDLEALVEVLDPQVVARAHQRMGAAPFELQGAENVAQGAIAARAHAGDVRAVLVNGGAGVVAYRDDRPFAVLGFVVVNRKIVAIDIFNDPELVPKLLS
jgi:RNA polymerase sigma factor (sigma-70 family)